MTDCWYMRDHIVIARCMHCVASHATLVANGAAFRGRQVTVMSAMTALRPVGGQGATRVRVHVPFDLRHSADLRQEFVSAIREGSDLLLVDLSESTVVDQVGFATLVGAHARAARAGRRLRFTGTDERTTRLLRRAGLVRLLAETPVPSVAQRRSRVTSAV